MKTAAFFDMDGTLLRGESQFTFLIWLAIRRLVRLGGAACVLGWYSLYLSGIYCDPRKLRKAGFGLLKGNSDAQIRQLGQVFFSSCLANRLRRNATTCTETHRQARHQTVLVTSAADIVADPVARHFNFDSVIATQLEVKNGTFTGLAKGPEPFADGKRQMVKMYCRQNDFELSDCFAYSDHHTDAPLLSLVGHPVVVNPTKKMKSVAKTNHWPVIDLDSDRMPAFETYNGQ